MKSFIPPRLLIAKAEKASEFKWCPKGKAQSSFRAVKSFFIPPGLPKAKAQKSSDVLKMIFCLAVLSQYTRWFWVCAQRSPSSCSQAHGKLKTNSESGNCLSFITSGLLSQQSSYLKSSFIHRLPKASGQAHIKLKRNCASVLYGNFMTGGLLSQRPSYLKSSFPRSLQIAKAHIASEIWKTSYFLGSPKLFGSVNQFFRTLTPSSSLLLTNSRGHLLCGNHWTQFCCLYSSYTGTVRFYRE
ncbi:uncharacterized protein LOC132278649 isoform X2 [Cornus florida]|uniref:uncharacterized protein LOC132278649 isoform X2 n=1 Tax=Cornus florida TaxID=4283 RepID=UPI0028A24219|nr:uncharacterized protein LOC132278649 isoform X2 [Cornus florida]